LTDKLSKAQRKDFKAEEAQLAAKIKKNFEELGV